jgi:hypothetical protein
MAMQTESERRTRSVVASTFATLDGYPNGVVAVNHECKAVA